jgi:uncharacterized membrane protein
MNTNCIVSCRTIAPTRGTKARALCLGLCALSIAVAASAEPRIITFEAPGAGATTNSFQGTGCYSDCSVLINNFGAITGSYLDANNVFHGFIRSPGGKFTTFDSPGADTTAGDFNGTFPNGINDAGAITGSYADASGGSHGFVRSPEGAFTTFDVNGSIVGTTTARALNLEGAIVGAFADQNGVSQPFLRRPNGTFSTWSVPGECDTGDGCFGSAASGINLFGTASSGYEDNSGNFVDHGLLRSADGKLTTFNVPGAGTGPYQGTGCPGCARPINLLGADAGFDIDENNVVHGYLRSPTGEITTFDAPGEGPQGLGCSADCSMGLNDFGAITGSYLDANNVYHGFLRSPEGKFTTFEAPGADTTAGDFNGTFPVSINDSGVITGYYVDKNNVLHGFLRSP